MIDREHRLSLRRQAELLELSRAFLYYQPVPTSEADLRLMRRIDELHLEWPFTGSRMLRDLLVQEGRCRRQGCTLSPVKIGAAGSFRFTRALKNRTPSVASVA